LASTFISKQKQGGKNKFLR